MSCHHRRYLLTCEDYAELPGADTRTCALCGVPESETAARKLLIDHDSTRGYWAARGLLCGKCNTVYERLNSNAARRYEEAAWWRRLPPIMDEPPRDVGAVVGRTYQAVWRRSGQGWADRFGRELCRGWTGVVYAGGPYLQIHSVYK
jgi:Recombination endonuclease VII